MREKVVKKLSESNCKNIISLLKIKLSPFFQQKNKTISLLGHVPRYLIYIHTICFRHKFSFKKTILSFFLDKSHYCTCEHTLVIQQTSIEQESHSHKPNDLIILKE